MARQKLDKTNAMRLLDQRRVAYEALAYDPAIHSAVEVADVLGVPPERVYKTLVVLHEAPGRRPLLVMIAGPDELDLRLLVRSIGAKAARMAPHRDAERLTGLQVGGIGALVPERRSDLARLGLRALLAATLANFLSASIAGTLLS